METTLEWKIYESFLAAQALSSHCEGLCYLPTSVHISYPMSKTYGLTSFASFPSSRAADPHIYLRKGMLQLNPCEVWWKTLKEVVFWDASGQVDKELCSLWICTEWNSEIKLTHLNSESKEWSSVERERFGYMHLSSTYSPLCVTLETALKRGFKNCYLRY